MPTALAAEADTPQGLAPWQVHGPLEVSSTGRFLKHRDGTPFFWLGDTAWQLFVALDRTEVDSYLSTRRRQGYNVVQAVALGEYKYRSSQRGLDRNAWGHAPWDAAGAGQPQVSAGGTTTAPNDYWDHVDYVLDRAAGEGLYVGLLPCWGVNYVAGVNGPLVPQFTETSARQYGQWLGGRYGKRPNLVWILGGDDDPLVKMDHRHVYRAMAEGLILGATGTAARWNEASPAWDQLLITFHPRGGKQSSAWFHGDAWLDFNLLQTGHAAFDNPNSYLYVEQDRALRPTKPTIDGEPRYEDHPAWLTWRQTPADQREQRARFRDADVRQAAWWSVLAGAAGHTYGHHAVWKFHHPGTPLVNFQDRPWTEAIVRPGAEQMIHLRRCLEEHHFETLEPAPQLLAGENPADGGHQLAATTQRGTKVLVYTPWGRPVTLTAAAILKVQQARWYSPISGQYQEIGKPWTAVFDPPGEVGRGHDWLLVLQREANATQ